MATLIFLVLAGLGIVLGLYFQSITLPYPYDAHRSQEIASSHLPFFKGGSQAPVLDLYNVNRLSQHPVDDEWLSHVRLLFQGLVEGVESVAVVTANGNLVLLDKYGYVHVAYPKGIHSHPAEDEYVLDPPGKFDKFYIGPGRPLGFHILNNHNHNDDDDEIVLLVCDSLKGLLQVNLHQRTIQVLSNMANDDGKPINYANDLDVGPKSGKVYFTSSTEGVVGWNDRLGFYDTLRACILNVLRGDVSGRLLVYDFQTRQTTVLLDHIFYANGVAVAHDESYVLVAETWSHRILKVWLDGAKAGNVETFIGRLPGPPDGLGRSNSNPNVFWVCIPAKTSPLGLLAPYPGVRQVVANILIPLLPKIATFMLGSTAALQITSDGMVVQTFLDSKSKMLQSLSGVTEYKGALFLGSLNGNYVGVMKVREVASKTH